MSKKEVDQPNRNTFLYHTLPTTKTIQLLDSSLHGLSQTQANTRLKHYGPNELKRDEEISPLFLFLNQFNNPLLLILSIAIIISIFLQEYFDAGVILGIIFLNGLLGFIQEYRAEKTLDMLRRLTIIQAKVLRNGKKILLESKYLVPGDIILLEAGDKIPADAQILECSNLETIESSLTGESLPVAKNPLHCTKDTLLAERTNMLYCTTSVTNGQAKAIVTTTGMNTQIGKIATSLEKVSSELTPFQKKIERFGKQLTLGIFCIALFIFILGLIRGLEWQLMLLTAIALAVAAIPEGLPAVITIALALGIQRMLSINVLIRRLPCVETLGSTTIICTDKTGTLTSNQMTVCKLWYNNQEYTLDKSTLKTDDKPTSFPSIYPLLKIAVLCNNAQLSPTISTPPKTIQTSATSSPAASSLGDPTELALLIAAKSASLNLSQLQRTHPRLAEISFTSERKMMTTIHKTSSSFSSSLSSSSATPSSSGKIAYTKGSVEHLLKHCTHILLNGKRTILTASQRQTLLAQEKKFAKQSLRVLGFAYKDTITSINNLNTIETALTFVGMQAMQDPLRDGVKEAIAQCHAAGIKVIMITGDHLDIAKSIAAQLQIPGMAITGKDLHKLNLAKEIESIGVIARVDPQDKLKIVHALQKKGHSVAMTGDGVNDAPALKKAQIGISMGKTGTDVAKEASDMVLLDDNFASIVHAIEQGRAIFQKVKTFILYLFSGNLAEILLILLSVLLRFPLPLLAIQILWINIVTETIPAIALSIEKSKPDVMNNKPTKKNEPLLNRKDFSWIILISLLITLGTLSVYYYTLNGSSFTFNRIPFTTENPLYPYAITMAFTTFVLFQMFNIINNKFHAHRTFTKQIWKNGWLWAGIGSVLCLQILIIYIPQFAFIFNTTPLTLHDWTVAAAIASSIIWLPAIMRKIQTRFFS